MNIRVFEAFAGYGSQSLALTDAKIPHTVVGISENDEFAKKAYALIHPLLPPNFGDITKIDWNVVPDFDLFTYSFPCQDVSSAGQQLGASHESNTRSSLLWACRDAIRIKRPRWLLMENVTGLLNVKHKPVLDKWTETLQELGYFNTLQVLNAKDFGIPQSRKRVFLISCMKHPISPIQVPLGLTQPNFYRDVLLPSASVPSKYDIDVSNETKVYGKKFKEFGLSKYQSDDPQLSKAVQLCNGRIVDSIAPCLPATQYKSQTNYGVLSIIQGKRIRKLSPRECFRLMGLSEQRIELLISSGLSDTQLYKLAGNSIVINVLVAIFRHMFDTVE
jgi:DNA (cytosine-5)-methyltransferase 1